MINSEAQSLIKSEHLTTSKSFDSWIEKVIGYFHSLSQSTGSAFIDELQDFFIIEMIWVLTTESNYMNSKSFRSVETDIVDRPYFNLQIISPDLLIVLLNY